MYCRCCYSSTVHYTCMLNPSLSSLLPAVSPAHPPSSLSPSPVVVRYALDVRCPTPDEAPSHRQLTAMLSAAGRPLPPSGLFATNLLETYQECAANGSLAGVVFVSRAVRETMSVSRPLTLAISPPVSVLCHRQDCQSSRKRHTRGSGSCG